MLELLWLIPALPLLGFLVLAFAGSRLPRQVVGAVGVLSVVASALVTIPVAGGLLRLAPEQRAYTQELWRWLEVGQFRPEIALYLDPLSLVMVMIVTFVGALIHVYSAEYMIDDEGYSRFFAYMNLFVGSMLILVLADNMLLLYAGWEGVGLCSYLLIGFWYKEPVNARAAMKAFIVTRIGDAALAVGLLLIWTTLGTLNIQETMRTALTAWPPGSTVAVITAGLLLMGAVGKSAQLPLHTWLPDAMAGPTPVSALIHAATMVTAGVYLIARTHVLFDLAPAVQYVVALIGVATLLIASCSALTQSDIKRVLAYSTISQIGYMFLALGVGAWSAAMFHFFTHAFFKALLFLAAGAVIISTHHEQDMFKLGGLARQLPIACWTFVVGAASLASLPLVTDGFFSKDAILWHAWSSEKGSVWLWAGGVLGAFITAMYAFRTVFLTFFGEATTRVSHRPGYLIHIPLVVLAVLSVVVGFVEMPPALSEVRLFSTFLSPVFPVEAPASHHEELLLLVIAGIACLAGIVVAYVVYLRDRERLDRFATGAREMLLHRFWLAGWGFDWLYDRLFVRPFCWLARINRNDFVDLYFYATAVMTGEFHRLFSLVQTGKLRHYATGIAIGAVVAIAILVFS